MDSKDVGTFVSSSKLQTKTVLKSAPFIFINMSISIIFFIIVIFAETFYEDTLLEYSMGPNGIKYA